MAALQPAQPVAIIMVPSSHCSVLLTCRSPAATAARQLLCAPLPGVPPLLRALDAAVPEATGRQRRRRVAAAFRHEQYEPTHPGEPQEPRNQAGGAPPVRGGLKGLRPLDAPAQRTEQAAERLAAAPGEAC